MCLSVMGTPSLPDTGQGRDDLEGGGLLDLDGVSSLQFRPPGERPVTHLRLVEWWSRGLAQVPSETRVLQGAVEGSSRRSDVGLPASVLDSLLRVESPSVGSTVSGP